MDDQGDILIVDDTAILLRLMSSMLSERGYKVRPVLNGQMALMAARAAPPDLILLDINMPEMNGYEVCQRLKADPSARIRDIPVIFISALDDVVDKVQAFSVGGVDYVTKPFQLEEVVARVETHLALCRLRRQLEEGKRRMEQELALAGNVQASFLPNELPQIPGWQLALTLRPARETSGDFYDVFGLPNGRLGLLIADVVDKGVGAALFMVLSWTLLRTYAAEYPDHPELALGAANRRILMDTKAKRFATVFYGILDPVEGRLVYCNAGHCPPYLVGALDCGTVQELAPTGVPLGMFAGVTWDANDIQLAPGDMLVLYTDGITEARDQHKAFFDEQRLLESVRANFGRSAHDIQEAILRAVDEFKGDAPQSDDMALAILVRDPA